MKMFRAERRETFRRDWKQLTVTVAVTAALAAWLVLEPGWSRVLAAFLFGCYVTLLLAIWLMGFDARSLRFRWGAAGEEWTARELRRLGPDWRVYHDLPNGKGNWDHVAVGPPGVFLIDSKNLRAPATVGPDGLRSGNIRAGGAASRGSAAQLKQRLEDEAKITVWVQAIVAVWGDLKSGPEQRDLVRYIPAAMITSVLENQPSKLSKTDREQLIAALDRITSARS